MDIGGFLALLESSKLATGIRDSLYLFPLIESFHVLGLTVVFGTTVVVDLRLLGIASIRRPFTRVTADIMRWTWAAFGWTATSGMLMFITNANVYYHNFFFRTKMALLALAGLNVLIFELTSARTVDRWHQDTAAPLAGGPAAVVSLLFCIVNIFMRRSTLFSTSPSQPPLDPRYHRDNLD